jgi:transposase
MRIRTLLNKCHFLKLFVYKKETMEFVKGQESLIVDIEARKNSKPICSGCGEKRACYDKIKDSRLYQFVPCWGFQVYLRYRSRRVNCPECGVKVEKVPWAEGKQTLTKAYQLFLSSWAKKLSWKGVATAFKTTWDHVYKSVKSVVEYGLNHRNLDDIEAVGVDEIQYGHGHQYLTVTYQLDEGRKRLFHIAKKRNVKSCLSFFRLLGKEKSKSIKYVCTDMWKPYLNVIKKKIPEALHILDRFHIVAHLNKSIDEVRKTEVRRLKNEGYDEVLKHSKYCFLKNEENLTDKQRLKLDDLMQYDLKSVRAYLLKESFQLFWQYESPHWAKWYLRKWCTRAMRSKLDPMKKFVGMIRRHENLILNWFKAKKAFSSGTVEGFNRNVNLVTRRAYGYRNFETLKIALYHTMGNLPEPDMTHRFF